jgi:hypothetical protein
MEKEALMKIDMRRQSTNVEDRRVKMGYRHLSSEAKATISKKKKARAAKKASKMFKDMKF